MEEINIEDFVKIDLRIARVKNAVEVPEIKRLLEKLRYSASFFGN